MIKNIVINGHIVNIGAIWLSRCGKEFVIEEASDDVIVTTIRDTTKEMLFWGDGLQKVPVDEIPQYQLKEPVGANIICTPIVTDTRSYNIGSSDYSKHKIQPWDIWLEYQLNPWDADIVKRVLRTKDGEDRKLDYEKIIHICKERIRQIEQCKNKLL